MAKKKSLEQLKQEHKKLQAEIQEARKLERKKQRQQRDKMMKIVGRYFLEKYEREEKFSQLQELLNPYLKSNAERRLFHLHPLLSERPSAVAPKQE